LFLLGNDFAISLFEVAVIVLGSTTRVLAPPAAHKILGIQFWVFPIVRPDLIGMIGKWYLARWHVLDLALFWSRRDNLRFYFACMYFDL
jgi:hypothetical protein